MPTAAMMLRRVKDTAIRQFARRGIVLDVHRAGTPESFTFAQASSSYYPVDFQPDWVATIERVKPFTLTTPERIAAVCSATEHIIARGIPGAFVECGVWRGGSMMAAALTLRRLGVDDREFVLFDTFTGATRPSEADLDWTGHAVTEDEWVQEDRADAVPQSEVHATLSSTGYPAERFRYVAGDIRETLPDASPDAIALLRLDTDYYDSTLHELIHLYPRVSAGGVLIIDDYGHYQGARRAVDEYFRGDPVFLSRIDYSARLAVKPR